MTDPISPLPRLPSEKLEDAVAEVGTEAAKSLLRGIARLVQAELAVRIRTKEAKAEAAQLMIKTKAEVDSAHAMDVGRRANEVEEIEHRAVLERRLLRLKRELEREQMNLEAIEHRALQLAEFRADAEEAREIDDDWMFAFARHAQDVSDRDVQEWWARILSAAAITNQPKLSPAALQTLTFVDRRLAGDFERFCRAVKTFGYLPAHDLSYQVERESQNIDLLALEELGLIDENPISGTYNLGCFELAVGPVSGVRIGLLHTAFSLTRRGQEIVGAVFRDADMILPEAVQERYLQDIVVVQMGEYASMTITPNLKPGESISPFYIALIHPRGPQSVRADLKVVVDRFDKRLNSLLAWAETRFEIHLNSGIPMAPRHDPTFG